MVVATVAVAAATATKKATDAREQRRAALGRPVAFLGSDAAPPKSTAPVAPSNMRHTPPPHSGPITACDRAAHTHLIDSPATPT